MRAADPAAAFARKKKRILLINLAVSAPLLAGILIWTFSGGKPPPEPPPPPVAAAPKPAPPPRADPFQERMKKLLVREKAEPGAFRALHEGWSALLADPAAAGYDRVINEKLDFLEGAANKAYRELYRPVQEEVRRLVSERKPEEARGKLQAWKVPKALDIGGRAGEEARNDLIPVEEILAVVEARARLEKDYRAGRLDADPEEMLQSWKTPAARAEAELAIAELRLIRAMGLLRRALEGRRPAAEARVEEVRRDLARESAEEAERAKRWEARLVRSRPIGLRQLGVDWDQTVQVRRFDARGMTFGGEGMEFTLGLDHVPGEVFGRLLRIAPDPSNGRDLLEAGKVAVRREAFDVAGALIDEAVKADPALKEFAPDLDRLRRGVGSLRGEGRIAGDLLTIAYDFGKAEQADDFQVSPCAKLEVGEGMLKLSGPRFFHILCKDLRFGGRMKITCEPAGGSAAYVLGAAFEVVPGESDLLVALVDSERGWSVVRLARKGGQKLLGSGPAPVLGGLEMDFDAGRVEFRMAGKTLWTGMFWALARLQPVAGGYAFSAEKGAEVRFRRLRLEGRVAPAWVQRLHAERLAVLDAELSREHKTTQEERAAARFAAQSRRTPIDPLPLEAEIRGLIPPKVEGLYRFGRDAAERLTQVESLETVELIFEQVRECLDEAVREAPWLPLCWYYRAEWRRARGDPAGALADLEEALKRQEGFVEARLARAGILIDLLRFAEAERELDAALAAVPDLAEARLTKALLHYYSGRGGPAIAEVSLARGLAREDALLRRSAKRLANVVHGPRWMDSASVEGEHYTVKVEMPRLPSKGGKSEGAKIAQERAAAYSSHLEAVRRWFATLARGEEGRAKKPLVFVFETPESYYTYADFAQEDRLEHTSGVYFARYQQMLFYRGGSEEETRQVMVHEAFHEYLQALAPDAPSWLNEGMAEYAGGVAVRGGEVAETGRMVPGRLRDLKVAFEHGWEGIPFDVMFRETQEQFYTISPQLQYAQAWSMIHFFVHHSAGSHRARLDRLVAELVKGTPPAGAHKAAFEGVDLRELRREWREYVRGLK